MDNNKTKTENDFSCVKSIIASKDVCKNLDCRHNLNTDEGQGCSIIAASQGPRTLQEIGDFYGISRMRVCQIEKTILKKIKSQRNTLDDFDPSA